VHEIQRQRTKDGRKCLLFIECGQDDVRTHAA
jgi:hypothetical protein